jgi:hypothetical protein
MPDCGKKIKEKISPEKTENQGPQTEKEWLESMVRRGAFERYETGANP